MCPTTLGRVQTRWAILIIPAIVATIISLIDGRPGWIVLIGVYFVLGVILDTVFYPLIIKWQPPWLTFTLAVTEFILVYILGKVLKVGLEPVEAILLFWIAWVVAIWTKVVILPLVSLGWVENAGEFRATDWSVAPEYQPINLSAFSAQPTTDGVPRLAREFSSVNQIPDELRNLPSPSGVHRVLQARS